MKQMPPRCWARCSIARRSRRGPDGPTISQSSPRGNLSSGSVSLKFDSRSGNLRGDPRFRNARAAAGFEHVNRLAGVRFRDPPADRPTAQPFVLEESEPGEVVVAVDVGQGIEVELPGALEPERTARRRIEMPFDDLAYVRIEARPRVGGRRRLILSGVGLRHWTNLIKWLVAGPSAGLRTRGPGIRGSRVTRSVRLVRVLKTHCQLESRSPINGTRNHTDRGSPKQGHIDSPHSDWATAPRARRSTGPCSSSLDPRHLRPVKVRNEFSLALFREADEKQKKVRLKPDATCTAALPRGERAGRKLARSRGRSRSSGLPPVPATATSSCGR